MNGLRWWLEAGMWLGQGGGAGSTPQCPHSCAGPDGATATLPPRGGETGELCAAEPGRWSRQPALLQLALALLTHHVAAQSTGEWTNVPSNPMHWSSPRPCQKARASNRASCLLCLPGSVVHQPLASPKSKGIAS